MEDTFISKEVFNLCEVTTIRPRTVFGDINSSKKSDFKNLEFVDNVKLRCIVNAEDQARSHSSTREGKVDLLSQLRDTTEGYRAVVDYANYLQDGHLCVNRGERPKYFPKSMGGHGAMAPFRNVKNVYLSGITWRGGTYDRTLGTGSRELVQTVMSLDRGEPASNLFGQKLGEDRENYLRVTWAGIVLIQDKEKPLSVNEDLPIPLWENSGLYSEISGFETRLFGMKRILPEVGAKVAQARTNRLLGLLADYRSVTALENEQKRGLAQLAKEEGGTRNSLAAVQRLLEKKGSDSDVEKLIGMGFQVARHGVTHLISDDCEWIASGAKGEVFCAKDICRYQKVFAWNEVNTDESMQVPGIWLDPQRSNSLKPPRATIAKRGLWFVTESQEEWADRMVQRAIEIRDRQGRSLDRDQVLELARENMSFLADDPILMRSIRDWCKGRPTGTTILIVTTDRKLCYTVCRMTGLNVLFVDPEDAVRALSLNEVKVTEPIAERLIQQVNVVLAGRTPLVQAAWDDWGSIEAYSGRMAKDNDYYYRVKVVVKDFNYEEILMERFKQGTVKVHGFLRSGGQIRVNESIVELGQSDWDPNWRSQKNKTFSSKGMAKPFWSNKIVRDG